MTESRDDLPYDFSDWQLGEDALSGVELAAFGLIEQAQADLSSDRGSPDFERLHDAVTQLVRENLRNAFDFLRSGGWCPTLRCRPDGQPNDHRENAVLHWVSEQDLMGEGHGIRLGPGDLIRAFMTEILSVPDELSDDLEEDAAASWEERWEAGFNALQVWRHAALTAARGMKAVKENRHQRMWASDRAGRPTMGF